MTMMRVSITSNLIIITLSHYLLSVVVEQSHNIIQGIIVVIMLHQPKLRLRLKLTPRSSLVNCLEMTMMKMTIDDSN